MEEYIYTRGKREGKEEGIREGIKEGIDKGFKKGREEGILHTAVNMLKNGLSVELISKVTGLPNETIENLKEEFNSKNN